MENMEVVKSVYDVCLNFQVLRFANIEGFDQKQSYLSAFNYIINSSIATIKNHIRALKAHKNNGKGAKRKSILLKDLRFPESVVMLIDEGNPYGAKANDNYRKNEF